MKIIDLLNMIARGEEPPKKIIFKHAQYVYLEDEKDYKNLFNEWLFDSHVITDILNDEVEILEITVTINQDKEIIKEYVDDYILNSNKIEKLSLETMGIHFIQKWQWQEFISQLNKNFNRINKSVNEIIDKLNEEE